MRSTEVATGKRSFFGRPEGFGSSALDDIVDVDAPDLMKLVAVSDYRKDMDCLAEEGSTLDDIFCLK